MRDSEKDDGKTPLPRWVELLLVVGLGIVLLALWILSLVPVRAELAMRHWRQGNVDSAHRLAMLIARQQPERADMWALKGRCEEQIEEPCQAALSYARAALAASSQTSWTAAEILTRDAMPAETDPYAESEYTEFHREMVRAALTTAAGCGNAGILADVYDALTSGRPGPPERRHGAWPGTPNIDVALLEPSELAALLPDARQARITWVDFLWRRGLHRAALRGSLPRQDSNPVSASVLWLRGQAHAALNEAEAATEAFRMAIATDPDFFPALVTLGDPGIGSDAGASWRSVPLELSRADVADDLYQTDGVLISVLSRGSLYWRVEVPANTRRAFITFDLRGTPAEGGFPLVDVAIEEQRVLSLEATTTTLPVAIDLGEVPDAMSVLLSLSYENDWFGPSGDRNLFVSSVQLHHLPAAATQPRR